MKRPTDRTTTAVVISATGFIVFALASMTFNLPPALTASGAAFFTGLTLGLYIAWELRRAYLSDLIDYYMTAHDTRRRPTDDYHRDRSKHNGDRIWASRQDGRAIS